MVDFVAPPASYPITGARKKSVADVLRELNLTEFLNGTGIPERAAALNELLNPLAAIPRAQTASQELFAPNRTGWERTASLGSMLGEVAGVVAPVGLARATGTPAVNALAEGLTGAQATAGNALAGAGDVGRRFYRDESGALRVWHGSPHDFDRFSLDKIGTGEGAQAYGHGLYFAENENIARSYRDALSNSNPYTSGQYYSVDGSPVRFTWSGGQEDPKALAAKMIDDLGGDKAAAIARARNVAVSGDTTQDWAEVARAIEGIGSVERMKGVPGRIYEAAIDANLEDFLDWDLPLSQQPNVLNRLGFSAMDEGAIHAEALKIMEAQPNGAWMNDPVSKARIDELQNMLDRKAPRGTGEDFYRGGSNDDVSGILSQMGYGDPIAQSQALREAGIKGIRYLDAGSRGVGEGSRNYVVFDDKLVNILGKDGQRTTPEGKAQTILDMLQSGRASEVTDDMLDLGDPVANARLNQYLYRNYDLPMDEASRLQRAGEMGFDTGTPLYHGTGADFTGFDVNKRGTASDAGWYGAGEYMAPNPTSSEAYYQKNWPNYNEGGNTLPVVARGAEPVLNKHGAATEYVSRDPRNIRSRFARFDPRLAHLKNLSAALIAMGVAPELLLPPEEQPRNALAQF